MVGSEQGGIRIEYAKNRMGDKEPVRPLDAQLLHLHNLLADNVSL